jgi:hypothetical protein
MPIAQIWEKACVSSPYILESVECNMCEQQIKTHDAYEKIYTKQRTSALARQHRSDWCLWPVRPVRSSQHTQLGSTGQTNAPDRSDLSGPARAQSTKQKGVCAIWSKVIRPGLQAGLDHFAPFSQHKQHINQYMHHNLEIESLNYSNKVQTHSSTHTNVLKTTRIKF